MRRRLVWTFAQTSFLSASSKWLWLLARIGLLMWEDLHRKCEFLCAWHESRHKWHERGRLLPRCSQPRDLHLTVVRDRCSVGPSTLISVFWRGSFSLKSRAHVYRLHRTRKGIYQTLVYRELLNFTYMCLVELIKLWQSLFHKLDVDFAHFIILIVQKSACDALKITKC